MSVSSPSSVRSLVELVDSFMRASDDVAAHRARRFDSSYRTAPESTPTTRGPVESWHFVPRRRRRPPRPCRRDVSKLRSGTGRVPRRLFAVLKPAGLYSETMGELLTDRHSQARRAGHADAFYVNAVDPDGRGVLLTFNVSTRARLVPTQRKRLSLIAAHGGVAPALASGPTTPTRSSRRPEGGPRRARSRRRDHVSAPSSTSRAYETTRRAPPRTMCWRPAQALVRGSTRSSTGSMRTDGAS